MLRRRKAEEVDDRVEKLVRAQGGVCGAGGDRIHRSR